MLRRTVHKILTRSRLTPITKSNIIATQHTAAMKVTVAATASILFMCRSMHNELKEDCNTPLTKTNNFRKSTDDKNKKNIVIIGGGISGHQIAYSLRNDPTIKVTMIDPKTYMELPMAIPRVFFNPELSKKSHIMYDDFLLNVTRVKGQAIDMGKDTVTVELLEGNQQLAIPYDYAVIATGVRYADDLLKPHQGNIEDRNRKIDKMAKELKSANNILIIGGGPVGVEMAAEISETWPKKNIILVQHQKSLLPGTSKKSISYATKHLTNNKVKIIFGTKVIDTSHEGQPLAITDRGDKIPYDMVINCCNAKPNTDFLKQQFPFLLDKHGRVIVDKNLIVKGSENRIFAVGDITNLDESRIALWASMHANIATTNIKALVNGKKELSTYKPATGQEMMIVTLGKGSGTACLPFGGTITWGWFVNKLKPDFLMSHYRRNIGLNKNMTRKIEDPANSPATTVKPR